MEALEALRGAIINGGEIKEDGDVLEIGGSRYAKAMPTPFKSTTGHYSLGALWFQYVNRAMRFAEYNAAAMKAKVEKVLITKKSAVVKYLEGKSVGGDNIDAAFSAPAKRARDGDGEEGEASRRRTEDGGAGESKASSSSIESVFREERPFKVRDTILLAQSKSFLSVLNLFDSKSPAPGSRSRGPKGTIPSRASRELAARAAKRNALESVKGTPIILVPSAATASINLYNVKSFLQKNKYVLPGDARKAMGRKPFAVDVYRVDKSGQALKYHVTDSVAKFRPIEWAKVVAVFANGQDWQFKGWTLGGDKPRSPVDIFSKVMGFHLHSGDLELPPNIKRWAVRVLHVHPSRPHLDAETVSKFWDAVDEWVAVKRPGLRSVVPSVPE